MRASFRLVLHETTTLSIFLQGNFWLVLEAVKSKNAAQQFTLAGDLQERDALECRQCSKRQ